MNSEYLEYLQNVLGIEQAVLPEQIAEAHSEAKTHAAQWLFLIEGIESEHSLSENELELLSKMALAVGEDIKNVPLLNLSHFINAQALHLYNSDTRVLIFTDDENKDFNQVSKSVIRSGKIPSLKSLLADTGAKKRAWTVMKLLQSNE